MNEDSVEINGVQYVSVESGLNGCRDDNGNTCQLFEIDCVKFANCTSAHRKDGRNVIFVEKQQ